MRIAVASRGPDPTSQVDPRFGRAHSFLVFDTESGQYAILQNSRSAAAAQGAGVKAAQLVSAENVDVVIAGNFGPKAFRALSLSGAKMIIWSEGTVSQAVDLTKQGQLEFANDASVEGHWM